ncbi:DMT family transporter [Halomonas heilongjiangensis]|uniref:DMT family transporter n=1 Tax=Halomonas heilongjiangensis TaxID=1387883 RepID=UPI001474A230|nr:DMT family transporter [Halomonas heilongjiangensis]
MNSKKTGVCLALLSVSIWAGNFVLARIAPGTMDAISLTFLRWLVASMLVLPFVVLPLIQAWRRVVMHGLTIAIMSLLGVVVFNLLVYQSGHYLDAARMSLINAMSPVFIMILAGLFLAEQFTPRKLIGAAMGGGGVCLSIVGSNQVASVDLVLGMGMMTVAAMAFSIYTLMFRKLYQEIDFMALVGATFFIGTLMLLPVFIFNGIHSGFPELNRRNVMIVLYSGILAALIAFIAWNLSVSIIGASRAGCIYFLMPVFAALQSFTIIGEFPGWNAILAAPIVLLGVYIAVVQPPPPKSIVLPSSSRR